jgi:type VI protein secretion system component VasF
MADTDIEIKGADQAALPPDALVGEIERTRADLARTIDEIADRVSPSNVARRTADRARERLSQVDPLVGGAVALAVVSVTCYLIWRRLRK